MFYFSRFFLSLVVVNIQDCYQPFKTTRVKIMYLSIIETHSSHLRLYQLYIRSCEFEIISRFCWVCLGAMSDKCVPPSFLFCIFRSYLILELINTIRTPLCSFIQSILPSLVQCLDPMSCLFQIL